MGKVIYGQWAGNAQVSATAQNPGPVAGEPMEYSDRSLLLVAAAWHLAGRHALADRLLEHYRACRYAEWIELGGELQIAVETADLSVLSQ